MHGLGHRLRAAEVGQVEVLVAEIVQHQAGQQEIGEHPLVGRIQPADGTVAQHRVAVGGQRPLPLVSAAVAEVLQQCLPTPVRLAGDPVGDPIGQHPGQRLLQRRPVGVVAEHGDDAGRVHAVRVADQSRRLGDARQRPWYCSAPLIA